MKNRTRHRKPLKWIVKEYHKAKTLERRAGKV